MKKGRKTVKKRTCAIIDVSTLPFSRISSTLQSLREQGKKKEADKLIKDMLSEVREIEKMILCIQKESTPEKK
jgi:hypothetical protein